MLNLKAAKELAAKELGTSAGSKALDRLDKSGNSFSYEEESLSLAPRFAVGDCVEYRSDTHKQWLHGTIQRVREGGAVYDLDVKKGAQANKLRPARTSLGSAVAPDLFDRVDRNHDGVISRDEFRGAMQNHLLANGDLRAPSAASTGRLSRASGSERREPTTKGVERRAPSVGRREPSALMPREVDTSLQARELQAELSVATRRIHTQQLEWADQAGRDMATRAGAVTVRKLVQSTKSLLHNFEGALMLRTGFLAGCFHSWRLQVELGVAGKQHREELEQHHDAWAAHFNQSKKTFEEELAAHADHQMTVKEKRRQQAIKLIDQWAEGEKKGLLRQSCVAWSGYALKQRCVKRAATQIHAAIFGWAEGKVKGTAHACLLSWHHLTVSELEVQKKEAEMEKLQGSYQQRLEEERKRKDQELAKKLADIEAKRKDRSRGVEAILLQWEKGKAKGSVAMVWKAWSTFYKEKKAKDHRKYSMDMQMRKWMEGDRKGSLHSCFLRWSAESKQGTVARQAEAARVKEQRNLEKMLSDAEQHARDAENRFASEEARRKDAAKQQVQMIVAKWEMGSNKGALKSVCASWYKYTMDVKRLARSRQAVHAALAKSLMGNARGAAHTALLNWKSLAQAEKFEREKAEVTAKERAQFSKFLEETQAEHDARMQDAYDSVAREKARAHQMTSAILAQWMGGNAKGMRLTCFKEWKKSVEDTKQHELQRNSVKDSLLRFIEGDQKAAVHSCWNGWKNYMRLEAAHLKALQAQDGKVAELEAKVAGLMRHKMAMSLKYVERLAGSQPRVLMGTTFHAWHNESLGAAADLEAKRQQELYLEEMERQREMAETKAKEKRALVAAALGYKTEKTLAIAMFEAWAYLWEKRKDDRINKLQHNAAMEKYSKFMIGKMLKQNDGALLASTFAEWHREGKILAHENRHLTSQQKLDEAHGTIKELASSNADLQDQLNLAYQQIELITETLQKELKLKEEMAAELHNAYDIKLRKSTTPNGTGSLALGSWSRTSSVEARKAPRDRDDLDETTPRLFTPRNGTKKERVSVSESKVRSGRPSTGGPPELPPAPTLPNRSSRGPGSSSHSREVSPTSYCDWNGAVDRMQETGIVHLRNSSR